MNACTTDNQDRRQATLTWGTQKRLAMKAMADRYLVRNRTTISPSTTTSSRRMICTTTTVSEPEANSKRGTGCQTMFLISCCMRMWPWLKASGRRCFHRCTSRRKCRKKTPKENIPATENLANRGSAQCAPDKSEQGGPTKQKDRSAFGTHRRALDGETVARVQQKPQVSQRSARGIGTSSSTHWRG